MSKNGGNRATQMNAAGITKFPHMGHALNRYSGNSAQLNDGIGYLRVGILSYKDDTSFSTLNCLT